MRKLLFLSLLSALFISCERPKNVNETNWRIIDIQVNSSDWKYSNKADNNFYYASIKVPALNSFIYNSGLVFMYVEYRADDGSYYQAILPSVRHYEEINGGNHFYWTTTIDYDYYIGGVTVYVTNSDFFNQIPESMRFVLKMIW